MKQTVITFLLFIVHPFSSFAQDADLNVFTIAAMQDMGSSNGQEHFNITCINRAGVHIDFAADFSREVKRPASMKLGKPVSNFQNPFAIGSEVYADFIKKNVSPMTNNGVDHTKSYLLIGVPEAQGFQITGTLSSSSFLLLKHLSSKSDYLTSAVTVYRHSYASSNFDSTFTLYQDISDSIYLPPGWYDIDMLGVRIPNVLLYNNFTATRIKAGILNVSGQSSWILYSKTGNKTLYNSSQAKKIELPTGIYQLDITGSRHEIEIKDALILDAATMEYSNSNIVEENNLWKVTNPRDPPYTNTSSGPNGLLFLQKDPNAEGAMNVSSAIGVLTTSMPPGTYNVKISGVIVKNVPVCAGCLTRIKAGALNINSSLPWTVYDSNKLTIYSGFSSKKVEFPVGNYQLEVYELLHQVEIRDGETLNFTDSSQGMQTQKLNTGTQPWEMKLDPTIKGIGGEVTMQLPKELKFQTHVKFFEAGDTKNAVASWFGNNKAKLSPGLYDVVVDDKYTVRNVPVEAGKQTRLKMGVFKVTGYGTIEIESSDHRKFSTAGPFSKILPEGTYYINGKTKFPIVIKDGELTEF
ncbi:MAG: hypothetical protein ACJ75F_08555 [Flavisolibacter sp.]